MHRHRMTGCPEANARASQPCGFPGAGRIGDSAAGPPNRRWLRFSVCHRAPAILLKSKFGRRCPARQRSFWQTGRRRFRFPSATGPGLVFVPSPLPIRSSAAIWKSSSHGRSVSSRSISRWKSRRWCCALRRRNGIGLLHCFGAPKRAYSKLFAWVYEPRRTRYRYVL